MFFFDLSSPGFLASLIFNIPPRSFSPFDATRRGVTKFKMSRGTTRLLLTASLTIALFLHNSVLVHAIPTSASDTTAVMASKKSGSIFKSALNAISRRGSTPDDLNSNANHGHPFPGTIGATIGDASPFWMEKIKHQGKAPFNPDPNGYNVFRNVKVRASLTYLRLGMQGVLILCLGLRCRWRWYSWWYRCDQVSIVDFGYIADRIWLWFSTAA